MSLDGDIALLQRVPLFSDLPGEQLRLIAFNAVRLELVAGQVLFRQAAKAVCGYVVSSGKIDLVTKNARGKESTVMCEAGVLIGETALFIETTRPGTAKAATAAQVIEIDRRLMTKILNEYPGLAASMKAKLADRLTATIFDLTRVRQTLSRIERLSPRR